MFRRLAWSMAWGSAAAGGVVVVAAWRCRSEVRLVAVHSPAACVNWRVSARDLELEGWPTREFDWSGYGDSPARVFGHVSVTTGTAPAADEADAVRHFGDESGWSRQFAGLGAFGGPGANATPGYRGVFVPTWLVAAGLFAPAVALSIRRRRRRRRGERGLSPACGYDLRASPGRCPECGRPAGPAGA